jgi:transposase
MVAPAQPSLDEFAALRAALARAEAQRDAVAADLATARAKTADDLALIAHQKLTIAKLQRQLHGRKAERADQIVDQLALAFEEAQASATVDELVAEAALATTTRVAGFERRRPSERTTFPDHLPRERRVVDPPAACACCGGRNLRKIGEDVTSTLEVIPRQWKVIETVREKVSCRDCERITQPPAPFHVIPRGWAGPSLLAMILFEKFGQHQPLNRLADRFAREGVPIALSTLADAVGTCCAVLEPLHRRLAEHVLAAERLHGDDTHVPVLASGKTATARFWTYVRDDRPFGGTGPPAALFHYSRSRAMVHPTAHLGGWTGVLQADAYGGYNALYAADREPGPVIPAFCWAHARRKFFEYADLERAARAQAHGETPHPISPVAVEAVQRIDALFEIERVINGQAPEARRAARQTLSAPLASDLQTFLQEIRGAFSRSHDLSKAAAYVLTRWQGFTAFLDDGRICLSNNAAERALRGIALGRKAWLFCGSDRGGERAATVYSLIVSCKLNDVDPQAWLADVLARIAGHPAHSLDELLPWNWRLEQPPHRTAA